MKYYVVKSTKTTEGDLRAPAGLGMYAVKMLTDELGEVAGRTFLKNNLPEPEFEEL